MERKAEKLDGPAQRDARDSKQVTMAALPAPAPSDWAGMATFLQIQKLTADFPYCGDVHLVAKAILLLESFTWQLYESPFRNQAVKHGLFLFVQQRLKSGSPEALVASHVSSEVTARLLELLDVATIDEDIKTLLALAQSNVAPQLLLLASKGVRKFKNHSLVIPSLRLLRRMMNTSATVRTLVFDSDITTVLSHLRNQTTVPIDSLAAGDELLSTMKQWTHRPTPKAAARIVGQSMKDASADMLTPLLGGASTSNSRSRPGTAGLGAGDAGGSGFGAASPGVSARGKSPSKISGSSFAAGIIANHVQTLADSFMAAALGVHPLAGLGPDAAAAAMSMMKESRQGSRQALVTAGNSIAGSSSGGAGGGSRGSPGGLPSYITATGGLNIPSPGGAAARGAAAGVASAKDKGAGVAARQQQGGETMSSRTAAAVAAVQGAIASASSGIQDSIGKKGSLSQEQLAQAAAAATASRAAAEEEEKHLPFASSGFLPSFVGGPAMADLGEAASVSGGDRQAAKEAEEEEERERARELQQQEGATPPTGAPAPAAAEQQRYSKLRQEEEEAGIFIDGEGEAEGEAELEEDAGQLTDAAASKQEKQSSEQPPQGDAAHKPEKQQQKKSREAAAVVPAAEEDEEDEDDEGLHIIISKPAAGPPPSLPTWSTL